MSETALRNVNSVFLSERRSNSGKKGSMTVLLPGLNDENLDISRDKSKLCQQPLATRSSCEPNALMEAATEPSSSEIEYVLSEDLKGLVDADVQLKTLLARLDSKEWMTVLEALNHVRQLCIFHTALLRPILEAVAALIIKAMKNPRSALCKTAIMASADLFRAYQDQLIDVLDPLLLQLLLKASQDKRFVCEEAGKALMEMTTWTSPTPMLEKLQPYLAHHNPRVRAKAAMCVYQSVSRLGAEGITEYGLESLIQIAAAQLNDRLPEARDAARKLVIDLHSAYCKCPPEVPAVQQTLEVGDSVLAQDPWEQFCLSKLSPTTAQAVLRITCIAT